MCDQTPVASAPDALPTSTPDPAVADDSFPWDAGVFDAHCHPTDTMASIAKISAMRARALTIMATRIQDQDLVASVAKDFGISDRDALGKQDRSAGCVVPAFGWHPWFSHQLFDDSPTPAQATYTGATSEDRKRAHYAAVLQPPPSDDAFVSFLPDPRPLSDLIGSIRSNLKAYPPALIGELGLDKAFRLPTPAPPTPHVSSSEAGFTPGGREGRLLSPHRVKMDHQVTVFKAQLALAGELGRPVSVHGVQAHGVLYDVLASTWRGHEKEVISRRQQKRVAPGAEDWDSSDEGSIEDDDNELSDSGDGSGLEPSKRREEKDPVVNLPYPPRICLHSFSGPVQMAKQYLHPAIPAKIFFSFSACINLASEDPTQKTVAVLQALPDDCILVESDLHIAGDEMDRALEKMYRKVCQVKGWGLRDGVERIGENYREFIFG